MSELKPLKPSDLDKAVDEYLKRNTAKFSPVYGAIDIFREAVYGGVNIALDVYDVIKARELAGRAISPLPASVLINDQVRAVIKEHLYGPIPDQHDADMVDAVIDRANEIYQSRLPKPPYQPNIGDLVIGWWDEDVFSNSGHLPIFDNVIFGRYEEAHKEHYTVPSNKNVEHTIRSLGAYDTEYSDEQIHSVFHVMEIRELTDLSETFNSLLALGRRWV